MFTLLMEALAQMFYFTGYIRSQSFAKPLSKEEEERCIALLAEKDREASTEENPQGTVRLVLPDLTQTLGAEWLSPRFQA